MKTEGAEPEFHLSLFTEGQKQELQKESSPLCEL